MKGTRLAIDGLAAYRVARFVVTEDAPAASAVRDWVRGHVPAGWAGSVDCQHCAGLWAALALGVLRGVPGARALAYPLAVGGLASLIASAVELVEETAAEPQGPVWETGTPTPPPAGTEQWMAGHGRDPEATPTPGLVNLTPRS